MNKQFLNKQNEVNEINNQVSVGIGLSHLLADTYTLYLKTQNYHWNVTGACFYQLHSIFETQYKELALAIDEIAERIRTLGLKSPGSYKEFMTLTSIDEDNDDLNSQQMISSLIRGNEIISKKAQEASLIARKYKNEVSSGLLISRIGVHEKACWILKSLKE
jgi:starvation-inducible DNA-binding protein